ncbi:hypothetical protein [Streptomyces xiamenensis]|uniref:hypothetical protein n=1 Tax=Streptomyces xiamenensis TaxID=408015 RepID=UPI0035E0FF22
MRYIHQIEQTEDAENPTWYTVITGDHDEEYDGTAAEYGRAVLENWVEDASMRGEETPALTDEYGNARLRVLVAFSEDDEAFASPIAVVAVVESSDLSVQTDPELAAVDAAREAALYADLLKRLALGRLGQTLTAARHGGHPATALANRAYPAVSYPVAMRMLPRVPAKVVWSVVRGESPTARIVEPGPAGVDVPDVILEWAAAHGLDESDPDVWLGVTLASDAGKVPGEIAYRDGALSKEDGEAIAAQLNEQH